MAETIAEAVVAQIQQNFGDTLKVFGDGDLDWAAVAIEVTSQLLILTLYVAVFLVAYGVMISAIRLVIGKRRATHPLFGYARTGMRYLFALGALLVILAQFGASPELLKAVARAGLMALGFFVVWLVLRRLIAKTMSRYQLDASVRQLVENVFSVFTATFAVVTVLAQFGFDVVSIVAGLGIVGIAVGFAPNNHCNVEAD